MKELWELFIVFAKIGGFTFGGGYAMLPILQREALGVIADKAIARKTGARALRSIIEEFMLDIMYEIPKDDNIGSVTITKAYIEGKGSPMIAMRGTPALPESPSANN